MKRSKRLWRTLFFFVLLAALCGTFAFPVVEFPVRAAPAMQAGTADLSLTMTVSNTTPNKADPVIFTITVSNAGPNVATGVSVKDLLPNGLTYVSDSSNGTYNGGTGIWLVGAVAAGGSATLTIITNATETGTKTNLAEVWTSDQTDSNSTPGNGSTTEDDDDSKDVTPRAIDLSLAMALTGNPTPSVGDIVTYTITISNTSATNPSGVKVNSLLPAGLT